MTSSLDELWQRDALIEVCWPLSQGDRIAVLERDFIFEWRAMLAALIDGRTDPATMAELAKGRLRAKMPVLEQALTGLV